MRRTAYATILLVLLSLLLASATPQTAAQNSGHQIALPQVAQSAQFPQVLPDGEITIDLGMTILDSPTLYPIPNGGSRWLVVVFRVDAGSAKNGGYQLEIDTETRTVVSGRAIGPRWADDMAIAPAATGRVANTQLSQVRGPDGRVSIWYVYSPAATGRGTQLRIVQ